MLKSTCPHHAWKWGTKGPPLRPGWKTHLLTELPKPKAWRDPRVWNKDKTAMKTFEVPQWDLWTARPRNEDMEESLQPIMDMPESLKKRRYDVPWWANPFGAWYLQNVLALETLKLPSRSSQQKIALYRAQAKGVSFSKESGAQEKEMMDDDTLIKKQIAERWRTLEFGDRSQGYMCSYADYIQFLNEYFKGLDEEGMQRLREHFDRKVRPYLAVMSHADLLWLEARTQNVVHDPNVQKRVSSQSMLGTPEFFDMATRLKYDINEDYKVRDELGPELFALWSKAPERWPPERLSRMYGLDFATTRKILVWHHFKACYDSCVEPDWTLPKRLFAMEWIRDVRARQKGKVYGRFRFAEHKISFYNDTELFKDFLNRREASYGHVWEMDDPYRFLQSEEDMEDYWGDNYDLHRRLFPEMTGRAGEPVTQYASMAPWGPNQQRATSSAYDREGDAGNALAQSASYGITTSQTDQSEHNWLFAEIGINVGHEPLRKVEMDPTNEKRRRFVIRQPDGTLRSAKVSEQKAFYWKEQWADFRFWTPYMPWGLDSPDEIAYQEHHPDTPDSDPRKFRRMATRPTQWFYESHYTNTGEYAGFQSERHMGNTNRPIIKPIVVNPAISQTKTKPRAYVFRARAPNEFASGPDTDKPYM